MGGANGQDLIELVPYLSSHTDIHWYAPNAINPCTLTLGYQWFEYESVEFLRTLFEKQIHDTNEKESGFTLYSTNVKKNPKFISLQQELKNANLALKTLITQ